MVDDHGRQRAEKAVRLVLDARGEVEGVDGSGAGAVAEAQAPEALDGQRTAGVAPQHPAEATIAGVEGRDLPAAKLADEEHAAEPAEVRRCEGHAPGRVE